MVKQSGEKTMPYPCLGEAYGRRSLKFGRADAGEQGTKEGETMRGLRRDLLIAAVTVITSQFYLNFTLENFRFSASAILLPTLIILLGRQSCAWVTGSVTACMVMGARTLQSWVLGNTLRAAAEQNFPAALFYLSYGVIFYGFSHIGRERSVPSLVCCLFCSDFFSNLLEFTVRMEGKWSSADTYGTLFFIAILRTVLACSVLLLVKQYQLLVMREEHEQRYQRLFLLITGLKTEICFMQKNSEEVEALMRNAYQLYERLEDRPEERKLALAIAKDVHEVKKDYLRIIRGIEESLKEQEETEDMHLRDLFRLLRGYCQQQIDEKQLDIELDLRCWHDFVTDKQWALMSVLKNLMINAMEALEQKGGKGYIHLLATQKGDSCVFLLEDNGTGISDKHIERIFDMGFSTKFDEKTGNIYRGVGLPGVKLTVEDLLGGTISVETRYGQYTRFRVRIPMEHLVKQEEPK